MTTTVWVQPRSTSRTDAVQAELIEQYLQRLQAGEKLDPSEFAARHPEHAEALRQLLPALRMMAELSCSRVPDRYSGPLSEAISAPELGVLGDFCILREVGRGGMGVVYEAEQLSLHRRVALKVLPLASMLDPRQLQRFNIEAQAAALLHHTNIVPIHAVGCERGVHYYAMQFIDGRTLAELINERRTVDQPSSRGVTSDSPTVTATARSATSTPPPSSGTREFVRWAVMLGIQAANALDHAHVHGVTHRDVKPANFLLDGSGCLWVTDFGLARLQDDNGLTMTGDLLGTLRYMSPEQALAKRGYLDHRTDIYSLGATLYELVTLQPAIDGEDRQEILSKIAHDEPIPPRRLSPAIPRELETVLLKAMNKEPQSRYATARELADDLWRFLEHRPVVARRPSALDWAVKWARRHRPVVASAAAGVLAVAAILASGLGWIVRDRAAREEAIEGEVRRALSEATALRSRSRWPEALEAAKRAEGVLAGGGGEPLLSRVHELRRDLAMALRLEEIRLPQDLSGPDGLHDDEWAEATYARAFREFGIDVEAIGTVQAAARVRARSIRVELALGLDHWANRRRRLKQQGDPTRDPRPMVAVARAADPDPLRGRLRDALEGRDASAPSEIAASPGVIDLPAPTLSLLVEWLDVPTGEDLLRRAQRKYPEDFWLNFQLAWNLEVLSRPRHDDAVRFLAVATALRPRHGPTHGYLARSLMALGRAEEAIWEYRRAIELKPDSLRASNDLAWILATSVDPRFRDPPSAVALARKAAKQAPRDPQVRNTLGVALYRAGDWSAAIEALEESSRLGGGDPYDWFFLAMARWRKGERDKARRLYDQAVGWMASHCPDDEDLRRFRVETEETLNIQVRRP
jgi:tetratricopeptide (TPR) repeat protein